MIMQDIDYCNDKDDEKLLIIDLSKETLKALINFLSTLDGLDNLGNLTDLSSIAIVSSDNYVKLLRVGPQTKPLVLQLQPTSTELIEYFTTHDVSRPKGQRCCAHEVIYRNGIELSRKSICIENDVFLYEGKYYYLKYDPTQSGRNRCCVFNAAQKINEHGDLVWIPVGPSPLFCGK